MLPSTVPELSGRVKGSLGLCAALLRCFKFSRVGVRTQQTLFVNP